MTDKSAGLADRIAAVVRIDASAPAVEFEGHWRTWGDVATAVEQVADALPNGATEVAVLLRNRPAAIGLLLGVLRAGGCVVAVDPSRGTGRVRRELASLDVAYVAGEPDDVAALVAADSQATRLVLTDLGSQLTIETPPASGSGRSVGAAGIPAAREVEPTGGEAESGAPDDVPSGAGGGTAAPEASRRRSVGAAGIPPPSGAGRDIAVRMLTSGTTGPPKRVDLSYQTLERVLVGAKHYESDRDLRLRLREGVAVVNSPLVHLGGLFRVLQCVNDGRSFVLIERFTVDAWVDAVRRHRPATASLVPAALRMVLDADVDPEALTSLRSVVSGTAPLSPDDADAFREKYGAPVLSSYAATEFGGGVAGWNIDDYEKYWTEKRGSVGRAHAGCELRVVDPSSGRVLGADEEGLLEVKAGQLGSDAGWIRTTDVARLDADGFLWIVGRADQAIIRGGFKVHPESVRAALERHPRVRGAAVVSRPDARLGSVPVAVVELRAGPDAVTPDDLLRHSADHLARYELPATIRIVDELPRTPSAKVDLAAVEALLTDGSGN